MEDKKLLDEALYRRGIVLTDYQKEAFNEVLKSISIFCTDLQTVISQILQDEIKPIVNELLRIFKDQPKLKIKYRLVKVIRPVQYCRISKPKIIHCRNNC